MAPRAPPLPSPAATQLYAGCPAAQGPPRRAAGNTELLQIRGPGCDSRGRRLLLEAGGEGLALAANEWGLTALHCAADANRDQVVETLAARLRWEGMGYNLYNVYNVYVYKVAETLAHGLCRRPHKCSTQH